MKLLTLTAGAALLAMSSTSWASIGPATTMQVLGVAGQAIIELAHPTIGSVVAADHEDETPIIRTAGRRMP